MWSAEKCQSVQSVMAKSQQRGHKYWHHVKTQFYCLGRALQFLTHDTAKGGRKKSWFLSAYFHTRPVKPILTGLLQKKMFALHQAIKNYIDIGVNFVWGIYGKTKIGKRWRKEKITEARLDGFVQCSLKTWPPPSASAPPVLKGTQAGCRKSTGTQPIYNICKETAWSVVLWDL